MKLFRGKQYSGNGFRKKKSKRKKTKTESSTSVSTSMSTKFMEDMSVGKFITTSLLMVFVLYIGFTLLNEVEMIESGERNVSYQDTEILGIDDEGLITSLKYVILSGLGVTIILGIIHTIFGWIRICEAGFER